MKQASKEACEDRWGSWFAWMANVCVKNLCAILAPQKHQKKQSFYFLSDSIALGTLILYLPSKPFD